MSKDLVNGVLIQGEVTFKVMVNTLVDMDTYEDEDRLKDFILEKAVDSLDGSDDEVEIINEVDVTLTEKTFDNHVDTLLSEEDWTEIIQEKRLYTK